MQGTASHQRRRSNHLRVEQHMPTEHPVQIPAMPVSPIHHRRSRQSSVLIYLHFLCIFKLLAADAATLEYAPISPNLPLYDDSLHTQRTRKWPPSPSSPPVPTGSRSDERAATRARRFSVATMPIAGPAKRRPGWIRGWRRTSRPFPASRPLATSLIFI